MKREISRVVAHRLPRRERGVMLVIALIVLVAMTLAGLGMMRSVDTASIIAGNIGFKQSTVSGADGATQFAIATLQGIVTTSDMDDNAAVGYSAHVQIPDPDWSDSSVWAAKGVQLNNGNRDVAGNRLSYAIERLCTCSGRKPGDTCAAGGPNYCASTNLNVTGTGTSKANANSFTSLAKTHYRITVLAEGPRNSRTVLQTVLRF